MAPKSCWLLQPGFGDSLLSELFASDEAFLPGLTLSSAVMFSLISPSAFSIFTGFDFVFLTSFLLLESSLESTELAFPNDLLLFDSIEFGREVLKVSFLWSIALLTSRSHEASFCSAFAGDCESATEESVIADGSGCSESFRSDFGHEGLMAGAGTEVGYSGSIRELRFVECSSTILRSFAWNQISRKHNKGYSIYPTARASQVI